MSMLIPGQNQLAEPSIVTVDAFEDLLAEFKTFVVEYVGARSPETAAKLKASLENESELLTLALEAFCVRLQIHERKYNARIKQMLAWWATGSNLDARLADMGLERQLLDPGDPAAYPPVAPVYESDDDARLRYYLAPHAPAAGSRMQYRREVFTLGERPVVKVDTHAPGEVMVTVLAREGDGTASEELLEGVREHFARPDVRPETDRVTVQGAHIKNYKIRVVARINAGPDSGLTKVAAQQQLQAYAQSCHRLEGRVDPSWIDYTLHNAGAVQLEILEPVEPIVTTAFEAPWCTGVEVEVLTL